MPTRIRDTMQEVSNFVYKPQLAQHAISKVRQFNGGSTSSRIEQVVSPQAPLRPDTSDQGTQPPQVWRQLETNYKRTNGYTPEPPSPQTKFGTIGTQPHHHIFQVQWGIL